MRALDDDLGAAAAASESLPMAATKVSAPGKVLLAGGYVVLEAPQPALVLCTGSRFYSTVAWAPSDNESAVMVTATSAQLNAEWRYALHAAAAAATDEDEATSPYAVEPLGESRNPFVENALRVVAAVAAGEIAIAAAAARGRGRSALSITLVADNDFYSQVATLRAAGLALDRAADLPPHGVLTPPARAEKEEEAEVDVHRASLPKTGLGSSAALTASLVGALLQHVGAVDLARCCRNGVAIAADSADLRLCHNAAQLAHLAAQGKVGSGFDIAAACWGSMRYVRFPVAAVADVLTAMVRRIGGADDTAGMTRWAAPPCVAEAARRDWWRSSSGGGGGGGGGAAAAFALPPPLVLLLGDVEGGSSTPSMVRSVLKWLDAAPPVHESAAEPPPRVLWAELVASNAQVERSLASLRALTLCSDSGSGDAADAKAMALSAMLIDMSAEACSSEWSAVAARIAADETSTVDEEGASRTLTLAVRFLLDARAALQRSRLLLRRMGERADVPIEPPAQRELCDYTETLPGVLGAGVPGAGGFDAIFAIVVGDGAAAAVRTAWAARGVSALAAADERTLRSGMQLEAFKEGLGK